MPSVLRTHDDFRLAPTAELLALFFRASLSESEANVMLADVLARPPTNKAERQLHAGAELIRRAMRTTMIGALLTSPQQTARYLQLHFRGRQSEVFTVVFLDSQHRVRGIDDLFFGTVDGTTVHPREVVRRALERNAAAVILAHNHPSGVSEPSQADIKITERLRHALALIDVRVLDHLVVADDSVTSLAERGVI